MRRSDPCVVQTHGGSTVTVWYITCEEPDYLLQCHIYYKCDAAIGICHSPTACNMLLPFHGKLKSCMEAVHRQSSVQAG